MLILTTLLKEWIKLVEKWLDICEDFNAHCPVWGSAQQNYCRLQIEKFLFQNPLSFPLNNKINYIHFSFSSANFSSMDLLSFLLIFLGFYNGTKWMGM